MIDYSANKCRSKDSSTVEKFVTELEEKSGKKENIELVSMDMSFCYKYRSMFFQVYKLSDIFMSLFARSFIYSNACYPA
jgi:hypothetical protein